MKYRMEFMGLSNDMRPHWRGTGFDLRPGGITEMVGNSLMYWIAAEAFLRRNGFIR